MSINRFLACVAGAAALLAASTASAASIFIDFDGVTQGQYVDGYYNGGADSFGASGPNLGVQFVNWGTTGGAGRAFTTDMFAVIDVAAGFNGLSFTYGSGGGEELAVFSGLDGTGTILALVGLPANDMFPFTPFSLKFAGVARSVLVGVDAQGGGGVGIDNLRLGAVPEPSTWAMMLTGFAAIGGALRLFRRKQAVLAAG
jgi:hypothetical protein